MLTGSVNTCKRLFVKEANQAVLLSNFLHDLHHQLVMVSSNIRCGEDRSQLVLCRCNFVMLCLSKNTELPEFFVEILHVSGYSRLDGTEVMIFELLALRCFCSEKCSSNEFIYKLPEKKQALRTY